MVEEPPRELPFFRGVLLNIHVAENVAQNRSFKVKPTRFSNGTLKGVSPDPPAGEVDIGSFKETLYGHAYEDRK